MVIGEKIAELRKKYNYTQENLAERIGVTRQTLSNWESNITSPDLNQASLLCKELKIKINDLVDNELELDVKDNSNGILNKLVGNEVILNFDYVIREVKCILDKLWLVNYKVEHNKWDKKFTFLSARDIIMV